MKRFIKSLLNSEALQKILCRFGAAYIRIVYITSRWSIRRSDIPEHYWKKGEPFITAIWHGRMLMMPYCWTDEKQGHMLISKHRDGQLISKIILNFGFNVIAGSTKKGGFESLREMYRVLKAGGYVGITPDGPRGPRMRASEGIVKLARLSGMPILPVTFGIRNGKTLNTWDRFLLPFPFSTGVIIWGTPINVSKELDGLGIESKRTEVENELTAILNEADMSTGRKPVSPSSVLWTKPKKF